MLYINTMLATPAWTFKREKRNANEKGKISLQ